MSVGREGRILLHCQAGCATEEVVRALGFEWAQLCGTTAPAHVNGNGKTHRNGKAQRKLGRVVETYDYTDEQGALLFQTLRYDPKDFRQRQPDGSDWKWDLDGVRRVLYHLPQVINAQEANRLVFVVEGEKDVHALEAWGCCATTNPMGGGKGKWLPEYAETLRGARVVVIPDNDPAGHEWTTEVAQSLYGIAADLRVIYLPVEEKGDVSDWIAGGGTVEALRGLIRSVPTWEPGEVEDGETADTIGSPGDAAGASRGLSDEVLARSFAAATVNRLMYVSGGQWFFYERSGVWQRRNFEHVERLAFDWMDERQKLGDKIALSARKISNVIGLAKNRLGPRDVDELDANVNWIGLRNVVYDLAADTVRDHSPHNLIGQIRPYDYDPEARCPRWMQFLDETLVEEDGLAPCVDWHALLQEFAGYLLVPTSRAQTSMFWLGGGANGKGVAQKVLERLVGEHHIASVLISKLDDPYHLAHLHGKLFATISELDRRALREKGQMLKAIIGGDRVSARRPHENVFDYTPTVRVLLTCNEMPRTDDTTEGYFRRIIPMLWRRHFAEGLQDPMLAETLRAEASGIFNWALLGLRRLEDRGWRFVLPDASKRLLKEYRDEEDNFGRFVAEQCEKCIQPEGMHTQMFYESYCSFCAREGEKERALRLQDVRRRLRQMGLNEGKPSVAGIERRGFYGIKLALEP